jgi:hypothetical protein
MRSNCWRGRRRNKPQRGETSDHPDGEEDGEDALVVLEQPKDHGERFVLSGGHFRCRDYSISVYSAIPP